MAVLGEASAAERRNAIRTAVSYNLPCDIWINSQGYPLPAKSRFFSLERGKGGPQLVVEAPVADGTIVPLRPGQEVDVFFRVDQTRYTYRATVLERGEFILSAGTRTRSLALTYPARLTRGQKREFYRVIPPPEPKIDLRYGLLDSKNPDPVSRPNVLFRGRSTVADVSAGGLAFELPERHSLVVRPGHRLLCEFGLPTSEWLTLHGRVAHIYRVRRERTLRYGVQFVDFHRAVEFKAAHDRLLRYVVEVQRQLLAQRAKLYE